MRILLVHASYQQRGGEDAVFEAELELLRQHGHDVFVHHLHNDAVKDVGSVRLGIRTTWSQGQFRTIRDLIRTHSIEVAHFHNTLPLISPAGYYGARRGGAAVVQTLHNYRMVCPKGILFRDGKRCESCVGRRVAVPALKHRCYRGSLGGTFAIANMQAWHRLVGTYRRTVDCYIALTKFARDKFIAGGMVGERIAIKPNFLGDDPGPGTAKARAGLFVGRLSEEKGVGLMLTALDSMPADTELWVVGDGPLRGEVELAAARDPRVTVFGNCDRARVFDLMREASALVFPSTNFEGFPNTIVEAFACGLPVVAGDLGAMSSLIQPGHNGSHFVPDDPVSLGTRIGEVIDNQDPALREGARRDFEQFYGAADNHELLIEIYRAAIVARCEGRAPTLSDAMLGARSVAAPAAVEPEVELV